VLKKSIGRAKMAAAMQRRLDRATAKAERKALRKKGT